MKKNLRKITVDQVSYLWRVVHIDPQYIALRLWQAGGSKVPWAIVRVRFDDPWLNYGPLVLAGPDADLSKFQFEPITSKKVAEIIRIVRDKQKEPSTSNHYELVPDQQLIVVDNAMQPGTNPFG